MSAMAGTYQAGWPDPHASIRPQGSGMSPPVTAAADGPGLRSREGPVAIQRPVRDPTLGASLLDEVAVVRQSQIPPERASPVTRSPSGWLIMSRTGRSRF